QTDGHVLWAHDFGAVFGMGQPTVESGVIYIAQSAGPMFSFMHAVSASLGQVFWSQPIDSQSNTYWAPLAAPGGRLYFDGGTFDGLYGLSTGDGAQLFFNGMLGQYDQWSPLFLAGQVYTYVGSTLRAHDPGTGAIVSTVAVPSVTSAQAMTTAPVSDGKLIYLVASPILHAFRPHDP